MFSNQNYQAALYLRLSKDDDGEKESASISNQRKMLLSYAEEKGFSVFEIYIDDGYSGTNFERPFFQKMIEDIEKGKINMVIVKDLSRLGRDYIRTGQYTELYFPEKKVRFIAINDGYDSEYSCDEMTPFRNMINEMYARDISKKIRSAFRTKMSEGSYIGNFAPFGYKKDPNNKNHLIVDHKAAEIVKHIFFEADQGKKSSEIADGLNLNGVLTPLEYRYKGICQNEKFSSKNWTGASISKILRNEIYLGMLIQGKTKKISFKSNKTQAQPKEKWIRVPKTHEAIINEDLFQTVQMKKFNREKGNGNRQNFFEGIIICKDCQRPLSYSKKTGILCCSTYKTYGSKGCSNHFILYEDVKHIVSSELKKELDHYNLQPFLSNQTIVKESSLEFKKLKKRAKELEQLLSKLYEDHLFHRISEEHYQKLWANFEIEQKKLNIKLEFVMENGQQDKIDWASPSFWKAWIKCVEIGQGRWVFEDGKKKKEQEIKIIYPFMSEKNS